MAGPRYFQEQGGEVTATNPFGWKLVAYPGYAVVRMPWGSDAVVLEKNLARIQQLIAEFNAQPVGARSTSAIDAALSADNAEEPDVISKGAPLDPRQVRAIAEGWGTLSDEQLDNLEKFGTPWPPGAPPPVEVDPGPGEPVYEPVIVVHTPPPAFGTPVAIMNVPPQAPETSRTPQPVAPFVNVTPPIPALSPDTRGQLIAELAQELAQMLQGVHPEQQQLGELAAIAAAFVQRNGFPALVNAVADFLTRELGMVVT